jgi:hypothetical protein
MKSFYPILLTTLSLLTSCSEYERRQGCTLDKLNLQGNVVKVETIMRTTVPYTEMLAQSFNLNAAIFSICGNITLDFDHHGDIKEYTGYGIDGKELFNIDDITNQSIMKNISSVIGKSNELSFNDIKYKKGNDGKVVETDYMENGKLVYKQKAYYDKHGDCTHIIKSYEKLKVKVDGHTTIENVDTTYFEYLGYDNYHNWTEALVIYKGVLPQQNDSYRIKRQITYDGEEEHKSLIDQLDEYNEVNDAQVSHCRYHRHSISGYGDISIPDFMVSKEENKKVAESAAPQGAIFCISTYQYHSEDVYATLNISTSPNNGQLDFDQFTENDLCYDAEADKIFKDQFTQMLASSNLRMLKWLPYQFENIQGRTVLLIRCYRYGISNPIPVYVESYTFCLDDGKAMNVMFSFQSNQYNRFLVPLREAISSIQLNQ